VKVLRKKMEVNIPKPFDDYYRKSDRRKQM
jgi:hypothetical protein